MHERTMAGLAAGGRPPALTASVQARRRTFSGRFCTPCSLSTRQIGATPNRARCSAMNAQINAVAGRSPARRNSLPRRGFRYFCESRGSSFEAPATPRICGWSSPPPARQRRNGPNHTPTARPSSETDTCSIHRAPRPINPAADDHRPARCGRILVGRQKSWFSRTANARRAATAVRPERGVALMQWWGWLILVVAVVAVTAGVLLAVQARRRSGGVIIADSDGSAGDDETGSSG